jgi:hypothetical protein
VFNRSSFFFANAVTFDFVFELFIFHMRVEYPAKSGRHSSTRFIQLSCNDGSLLLFKMFTELYKVLGSWIAAAKLAFVSPVMPALCDKHEGAPSVA